MPATEYLVFRQVSDDDDARPDTWAIVGTASAASADVVKQAAALEHGDGTYAAVPSRSWQPTAFKVEPRAVAVKDAS